MLAAAAAALRGRVAAAASTSAIWGRPSPLLAAATRAIPAASTPLTHTWPRAAAWVRPASSAPSPPSPSPPPPWTPTHALTKRKFMPRRMAHLLQLLEAEAVADSGTARAASAGGPTPEFPDFRAGDVLEVRAVLPDARRRVAVLRGVCIGRRNRGVRSSFDILTHVPGGGAVHRTFPLHSPMVHGVRIVERRRARRAKLYYLKDRNPKEYRT